MSDTDSSVNLERGPEIWDHGNQVQGSLEWSSPDRRELHTGVEFQGQEVVIVRE